MHVVDEFPAKLQVKLAPELASPGLDVLALKRQILFPVESNFVHFSPFVVTAEAYAKQRPDHRVGPGAGLPVRLWVSRGR